MNSANRCFEALEVLIVEADPNGIPIAERTIDAYLGAVGLQSTECGDLQRMLKGRWKTASTPAQADFVEVLIDYVGTKTKP